MEGVKATWEYCQSIRRVGVVGKISRGSKRDYVDWECCPTKLDVTHAWCHENRFKLYFNVVSQRKRKTIDDYVC